MCPDGEVLEQAVACARRIAKLPQRATEDTKRILNLHLERAVLATLEGQRLLDNGRPYAAWEALRPHLPPGLEVEEHDGSVEVELLDGSDDGWREALDRQLEIAERLPSVIDKECSPRGSHGS